MFKNKVVVITGAGSGIGRALASEFARAGAQLALSDIDPAGLALTIEQLPAECRVRSYIVDVADCAAVFAHANDVKRDFGTAHVVINNAGATVIGSVVHTSIDEYRWQLDLNMYGVLYGTKAFLPMLLEQREGWIVNISSFFGLFGYPGQSAYSMSKFAVRALTECLWSELDGTGVSAVCVHPGGIKTNIEKSGRLARMAGPRERDIAATIDRMLTAPPELCAADIVRGLRRGQRRIVTGTHATLTHWMTRLFPNSYPALLKRLS